MKSQGLDLQARAGSQNLAISSAEVRELAHSEWTSDRVLIVERASEYNLAVWKIKWNWD